MFLVGLWTDGVSGEGVMLDETAEGCVRCWSRPGYISMPFLVMKYILVVVCDGGPRFSRFCQLFLHVRDNLSQPSLFYF